MNEAFADTEPTSPFSEVPSAKAAADDLRAAAGGSEASRISPAEEKALQLKEAAVEKATQLRDFAGEKAIHLRDVAASKATHVRDSAGETALHLRGAAEEQWQETRLKAREFQASMEDSVRTNPTKAILVAAGIGFLAGLIIRR